MEHRWPSIKSHLKTKGLPAPEDFGIGSHYGEVIIGDIGSNDRKNITVIGDVVNIASRLEAETRHYDGRLLISSTVYNRLNSRYRIYFNEIGNIDLKGKEEQITTFIYKSPKI
jgi:class 3 adenylate cyclase